MKSACATSLASVCPDGGPHPGQACAGAAKVRKAAATSAAGSSVRNVIGNPRGAGFLPALSPCGRGWFCAAEPGEGSLIEGETSPLTRLEDSPPSPARGEGEE